MQPRSVVTYQKKDGGPAAWPAIVFGQRWYTTILKKVAE
jgi:hypothetical protein